MKQRQEYSGVSYTELALALAYVATSITAMTIIGTLTLILIIN